MAISKAQAERLKAELTRLIDDCGISDMITTDDTAIHIEIGVYVVVIRTIKGQEKWNKEDAMPSGLLE